jgi:WD40 repeat protein
MSGSAVRRARFTAVVATALLASTLVGEPAFATAGSEQWAARFPGPQFSGEDVAGLAVSPDGSRVFRAGTLDAFSNPTMWTVAYDSAGTQVWARRGTNPDAATAAAISISPDGSTVFVAGTTYTDTRDYVTIAYDATTGVRLWKRRYSSTLGRSADDASALVVSPDGSSVFVTGTSDGSPYTDYDTVAYAADTGHLLWTARYDGGNRDSARTLSASPDGSAVFVSGFSVSATTALDIETVAYDTATGERLWKSRFNGGADRDDQANAMSASPDGSTVYVAGFSENSGRSRDFVTLAYRSSTGSVRWVRRYNGPRDSNDNVKAMTVSGSRVFVAGYRSGHDSRDAETIAYAQAGGRLWSRAYSAPQKEKEAQATAIGVSPDGTRVYTVGFRDADPFPDSDFVTIAYRASSGNPVWEAFYDHDDPASPSAVAVNPDGSAVYTSGRSRYDLATVAYSTG